MYVCLCERLNIFIAFQWENKRQLKKTRKKLTTKMALKRTTNTFAFLVHSLYENTVKALHQINLWERNEK